LKNFADFKGEHATEEADSKPVINWPAPASEIPPPSPAVGLNLSYTINLNLPATSDQAVFNAIFKSLKEHLISNE
jgi:hypothetical protein